METRFYRFSRTESLVGVARLTAQVRGRDLSIHILCRDEEHAQTVSEALWVHNEFLPHSLHASDPISGITVAAEIGEADVLFVIDDSKLPEQVDHGLICYLFHAADLDVVESRRKDWKRLRESNQTLSYWAETEQGGWEKKAEVVPS